MKYKLIAMDMDGTLLNSKKEVTEYTKDVLRRAAKEGVKLVVCTGRIFTSAKSYARIIGTKAPIIASNGAYIREKDREEVIYEKYINKDTLIKIIKVSREWGFYPHIYTTDTIYSEKLIHSSLNYTRWNETVPEDEKINIKIVDRLEDVVNKEGENFLKVVVMADEDQIERLQGLKKYIRENMDVSVFSSYVNNFEVMDKEVSKGRALKILAEYFGINKEEIICFGDNENDKTMFEFAGFPVAMGNAEEEIKKIAAYVTDTNDNDGVAKAIEKFVLNK
ncbi:Cof-type HAD-IIB family hydrolase [Thermobrachium celere]|uniref:Hydrolase (HAD superfamily) n=1 Tax=Thermobrachium celere DSM 8682 TaxID=941824 RepID=R7RR57_9CLOT|nr:Cof-type HAD-IIB family hydrolase [Thermobrachium celere]CDF58682.1 Hydrolase (HAD superfamily) [Thermobrachium celere DSM 8682]